MFRHVLAITFYILISLSFVCNSEFSQESEDWPFTTHYKGTTSTPFHGLVKIRCNEVMDTSLAGRSFGREYYCSGNLHAEGPLLTLGLERNGLWKVYFDSSLQILRSEGVYRNDQKHGRWVIYARDGKPKYEFIYVDDVVKTEIDIDENGNRDIIISRNNGNIFMLKYQGHLIFILITLMIFHGGWNRITYNRLHDTHYLPGIYKYDPDNNWINFMCLFIFWWPIRTRDSDKARRLKRRANFVSVFAAVFVLPIAFLLIVF